MTHIHTITYDQAKKWYESGRKYKPIGTKLTKDIWLNYDEANDRYTLAYTDSKYYEVVTIVSMPDGTTKEEKAFKKASASERDKYTQEFIGFVYRDHAHIFHPGRLTGSSCTARNFFESRFNCTYRRYPGVKVKGFEWTFFREGLSYWERTHRAGEVVMSGGAGMYIYPDGRREAAEPPMVRVHKKEQQNAMNRHIKAVRRMLTLRAKLGGFNSVDWPQVSQDMTQRYGRGHSVLRNSETVNKMFMAINDEDYLSMLPVLWLAACRDTPYYWLEPKWAEIGASYDWTSAFNHLVDSVREDLRNEQGAVEYKLESEVAEKTAAA